VSQKRRLGRALKAKKNDKGERSGSSRTCTLSLHFFSYFLIHHGPFTDIAINNYLRRCLIKLSYCIQIQNTKNTKFCIHLLSRVYTTQILPAYLGLLRMMEKLLYAGKL
jgi:hypothetical protein